MDAAVVDRYGPPEIVRIAEVPRPQVRADQALVRVHAAAVTSGDARIRAGRFPAGFAVPARLALGIRGPRRPILGGSCSGVVEEVGDGVTDLQVGDEVCAMTGMKMGGHAQFVAVPAAKLVRVPAGVSHEDAAAVMFGGTTAWYFLADKASVGPGTSVLVNGASGAVGTNAVQVARHLGATVTGVTSAANAELVTSLGAERIIDHRSQDLGAITDRFDVVLDAVGNLSIASGRRLLRDGGTLVLAVASLWEIIRARGNVVTGSSSERVEDIALLLGLVADGELAVVHDRTFDLDDIVDAYRCVDGGHKVGNVVVRPRQPA